MSFLRYIILAFCGFLVTTSFGQLNMQPNSKINLGEGGFLVVTGNVFGTVNITGKGVLLMKGTTMQQLNMNGAGIAHLAIDNSANVNLVTAMRIDEKMNFINGKVVCGYNSLYLSDAAVVSGAGPGRFVETNGSGQLRKHLLKNTVAFLMPVGAGTNYAPVMITTNGSYAAANVGVYNKGTADPNKPAGVTNYLNTYWGVSRKGVTGTVTAVATYNAGNVVGSESTLKAYLRSGTTFTTTGASMDINTNKITGNITGSGNGIYAMSPPSGTASNSIVNVDAETGLNEQLYPNPATSECFLQLNNHTTENVLLQIIDNSGRIVRSTNIVLPAGNYRHKLDVSSLKPGTYNVVLSGDKHKRFTLIVAGN